MRRRSCRHPSLSPGRAIVPVLLSLAVACGAAHDGDAPADRTLGAPEPLPSPAADAAGEPNLFTTRDGRLLMSWLEPVSDTTHALRMATLDGGTWDQPRTVVEAPDLFVNWADFPSVVEAADGSLWAHWLQRSGPDTYAYDVVLARSDDRGETWGQPFNPHRDGTATEHGFVSLVPGMEGGVTAVWLDGRRYAGVDLEGTGMPDGAMTLRSLALEETPPGRESTLLDERICDCCQTSAAYVGDTLVVVYRDRSEEEIRDIAAVTRDADGWHRPVPVAADNWKIPGCPVNGPALTARNGSAAVAWFAMVDGAPEVRLTFTDDGRSFEAPSLIERGGSGEPGHATLGRVDAEWIDDDTVLVVWLTATGSDSAEIRYRTVDRDGSSGPSGVLAATHPSRASGFPRIARVGERLVAAWTLPGTGVELAGMPLLRED